MESIYSFFNSYRYFSLAVYLDINLCFFQFLFQQLYIFDYELVVVSRVRVTLDLNVTKFESVNHRKEHSLSIELLHGQFLELCFEF